jgi:hypothetical protein
LGEGLLNVWRWGANQIQHLPAHKGDKKMANRYGYQFSQTLEKKVVNLYAKVTFGASGAPTLSAVNSKGIVSVTRNSAGIYTFVFGTKAGMLDVYNKLLCVRHVLNSGSSAPASPALYVKADSVATSGTCSLQIVMNSAGTATDPASGEIGYFNFTFGDSTAP